MRITESFQTRSKFIVFTIVLAATLAANSTFAECNCPPGSADQAIRDADRVFHARVVSAGLSNDVPPRIEFTVAVSRSIRGNNDDQYRLTTALPDACGINIRLGFSDVYVLRSDDTHVSPCTANGRSYSMQHPFMSTAIALVDLPIADIQGAQKLLRDALPKGYDRRYVDQFFFFAERIDPTQNKVIILEGYTEYRGVKVHIVDGKLDQIGAH